MNEFTGGVGRRTTFFKPTRENPREKRNITQSLAREGKSFVQELKPSVRKYQIDTDLPKNQRYLYELQTKAKERLEDLGFTHANQLVPNVDQLSFSYALKDDTPFVRVGNLGEFIQIQLPLGTPFVSPTTAHFFYHELSHFITKRVLKVDNIEEVGRKKRKVKLYAAGFTRFPIHDKPLLSLKDLFEGRRPKGIFEDGLSDLFALYCMDQEITIESNYNVQLPFMMALLKRYAKLRNISSLDAFKRVFKAKATRDFTFQKELVELFGTTAVKDLNNLEIQFSHIRDHTEVERVAREFGIIDEYNELRQSMNSGQELTFEGMTGRIGMTGVGFDLPNIGK